MRTPYPRGTPQYPAVPRSTPRYPAVPPRYPAVPRGTPQYPRGNPVTTPRWDRVGSRRLNVGAALVSRWYRVGTPRYRTDTPPGTLRVLFPSASSLSLENRQEYSTEFALSTP